MRPRSLIGAVATIVLAVAVTGAASASNAGSTVVFTDEIDFTFPAGICPDLPADLSIHFTGTVRGHAHVSVDGQGVVHVSENETITGTAVDSDGAVYRFNYHDTVHFQFAGFPVVVTTNDHFNLVGNGAANQLHTFFTLKILVTETSQEILFGNVHGDPELCDPL
jgi:hypothetical protein